MRKSFAIAASLLLAGCNFAPKHVTPALSTPTEFPPEVSPEGSIAAADIAWQDFFLDERLRVLIVQTLENNRDLRIAVARIEEARGLYRIQRAEQLPQLGGSAGATRSRIGANSLSGGVPVSASGITSTNYDIGVAVTSFELDF